MSSDPVSTEAVDYLQRLAITPPLLSTGTAVPFAARRAVRVTRIGQPVQAPIPQAIRGEGEGRDETTKFEPPTLPLLVALAGARTPIALLLDGTRQGVSVRLGTWAGPHEDDTLADARQVTLLSVLGGCYPAVDVSAAGVATPALACSAIALGVPGGPSVDPRDGGLPVDRLLRSVEGQTWAALVLAQPLGAAELSADRNRVLNEMRMVSSAVEAVGVSSPLAEHYLRLLKARLNALADAQARGGGARASICSESILMTWRRSAVPGGRCSRAPRRSPNRCGPSSIPLSWTWGSIGRFRMIPSGLAPMPTSTPSRLRPC